MSHSLRILILEDSPTDAEVMVEHLREAGYAPDWKRVETEADYLAHLEPSLDLILVDYTLPDINGRRALQLLQDRGWDIPAIIVTGTVSEEIAIECLRLGAADYLLKDRLTRLGAAVRGALAQRTLRRERDKAEEARLASEARARFLAEVLEKSSQPFGVGYSDGHLGICNAAFCGLLGYSETELRALDWSRDLTPPEWRDFEANYLAELHRRGQPVRYEKEILRKDGSRVPVELLVHLVQDELGNPQYYYAFITDLSERLRAEQDLAARTRQLEAARTVNAEITRELDLGRLVALITRRSAELVGAGAGATFLWEDGPQQLVARGLYGETHGIEQVPLRLGEGVVGRVAQRREGVLLNSYRASPEALPADLANSSLTAVLAEPLLLRDRLLGVLSLENHGTRRAFTREDQELLRLFAAQAALAIENAHLFADLTQSYRALQQTHAEMIRLEKLRVLG
jgi:PAS domain S-box-containing protein